jgi:hypothetical protein
MVKKSKGHIAFEGPWEYFEYSPPGKTKQIYRAPIENFMEIGTDVRVGARFEAYAPNWYAAREREKRAR